MIEIECSINCKPEKLNNYTTRIRSEKKKVPVLKIRKHGQRYQALISEPEKHAPYNHTYGGQAWVYFLKNRQDMKLPVLEDGEELDV